MPELPRRRAHPKQARSRETVASILEATRQILESASPHDLTTQAIAQRAGVGIASLYRYFPISTRSSSSCAAPSWGLTPAIIRLSCAGIARRARPSARWRLEQRIRFICARSVHVQRRLARLLGPRFYARYFGPVSEAVGVSAPSGVALMGSAVFFVVAPCTLAGLVPWSITGWQLQPPFFGLELTRGIGAILILAGVPGLVDAFARFALQGLGTPAPPSRRPGISW